MGILKKNNVYYKNGLPVGVSSFLQAITKMAEIGEKVEEPNHLYPDESYEQFISRMIIEKKKKIERVLDLY